ncbi:MAG: hypothetical protein NPIRA01_25630 [Nitrospirales bacterium]|nr:MAG: hypothetical protein NPIRA01_25630 [Nitrospirales bacterium]
MRIRRMGSWPFDSLSNGFSKLQQMQRDLERLLNGRRDEGVLDTSAGVYPLMNVTNDHVYA